MLYMSSAKKLLLFSALPSLFLISCALSTMSKNEKAEVVVVDEQPTTSPPASFKSRAPASKKFRTLTLKQIKTMPAKDVFNYYKKLHAFVNEMEKFQDANKPGSFQKGKKKSAMFQLIEEAFAGTETAPPYTLGNNCLIGGYWGNWVKRANGSMTCDSPNRCTTDTGDSGHKCNPKFFSYMDATSRKEFCVPLKRDLTRNSCDATVKRFYDEMGAEAGADHFRRSLVTAITDQATTEGRNAEELLQQTREEIYTEYQRIYNYCGETEDEWKRHTAGQYESCFNLQKQYDAIDSIVGIEAPPTPPTDIVENPPAEVPAGEDGDGLGKFSCIKSSLDQNGYPHVSTKYIAMFAAASKWHADTEWVDREKRSKTASRESYAVRHAKALRSAIVSLVDIGLCKDNLPRGKTQYKFEGDSATAEAWLNMDKLPPTFVNNPAYEGLFGLKLNQAIPYKVGPVWERQTPTYHIESWANSSRGTAPNKCVKESNYRIRSRQSLCEKMFQICGIPQLNNECRVRPDTGGNSSGGNDNGGNNNGNNNGHTNGTTTDSGSDNEVGSGSNAEAGHQGNGDAGMGSGPGN